MLQPINRNRIHFVRERFELLRLSFKKHAQRFNLVVQCSSVIRCIYSYIKRQRSSGDPKTMLLSVSTLCSFRAASCSSAHFHPLRACSLCHKLYITWGATGNEWTRPSRLAGTSETKRKRGKMLPWHSFSMYLAPIPANVTQRKRAKGKERGKECAISKHKLLL